MFFKFQNLSNQQPGANPFTMLAGGAAKWLFSVSLFFFVMGLLIVKFPEIFANIVGGILFFISVMLAITALKIWLGGRRMKTPPQNDRYIDVEVSDVDD